MNKNIVIFIFISILSSSCVWAKNGIEKFYLIEGVYKITKREDLNSNTVPWLLAKDQALDDFDGEITVVTHGCHFYDIEYFLKNTEERINVRVQTGEFCDLREVVFPRATVIKVKYWDNIAYLQESARLVFDKNDKAYIPGSDLPSSWNLSDLLEESPVNDQSRFCRSRASLSPRKVNSKLRSGYAREFENSICDSHLLPISKIKILNSSHIQ